MARPKKAPGMAKTARLSIKVRPVWLEWLKELAERAGDKEVTTLIERISAKEARLRKFRPPPTPEPPPAPSAPKRPPQIQALTPSTTRPPSEQRYSLATPARTLSLSPQRINVPPGQPSSTAIFGTDIGSPPSRPKLRVTTCGRAMTDPSSPLANLLAACQGVFTVGFGRSPRILVGRRRAPDRSRLAGTLSRRHRSDPGQHLGRDFLASVPDRETAIPPGSLLWRQRRDED